MLANVMLNLDALPGSAAPVLIDAFLKGVLLLVVCSVAVFALRRASAALRHLIWTIGLAGVLIMPALNAILPDWRVLMPMPVIARTAPASDGFDAVILPDARALSAVINEAAPSDKTAQQALSSLDGVQFKVSTKPQAQLDWRVAALLVWLGGFALSIGSLLFSVLRVRGLQRGTQEITSGPCVDAVQRAARRIGLRNPPRVHVGGERMMPMVWGLFRPVLLLPAGAARWPAARLEAVLLHELSHVRRRDALTQLIAEIARAIYWFNPLVWIAARQMYLERELACDDMVLNAGTRPSDYAGDLLDLVRSLKTARATGMAAIAMARPSQIKVRLRAVLDEARSRGALERRVIIGASIVALGIVAPLAAARPREASAKAVIPAASETVTQAPAARAVREVAPAAQATIAGASEISGLFRSEAVQETCFDPNARKNGTSISSNSDDDITTVKWVSGRCSGHIRMEGKVRFSGDLKSIQSISAGGIFQIDEDDGRIDRRLTVRPGGSQLEFDYRVDGKRAEYDATGRAWFANALLALYRSTGFAADERVDYLLSTQGPAAVVAEVDMMRSDYVQRLYLQKLLDRSNLSPALVKSAVDVAAREIDSDYELAELLISVAGKYDFNDETRKMFIDATRTIQSDYEQRRVLGTALKKGDLDNQDITAMLKASTNISSDYERAELLVGLTQKYKMDESMRTAYLDAAKDIRSDYEKRRVYQNLLKQGAMTPVDLANVLEYAAGINSDYEKAEVLIGLNHFDLADAALQRAYLTAATGIRSDYEHRRVLMALLQKDKLTPANVDIVLKSALDISSDYELAELLLQVASKNELSGPQRDAFMKALNSISSSYEYGRVASALLRKSN